MSDLPPEDRYDYEEQEYAAAEAEAKVQGPAIGLIVTAILGMMVQLLLLALRLLGMGMSAAQGGDQAVQILLSGTLGAAASVMGLVFGVVVLLGALKMRKLESHGFALAASIIAMIPCVSPCCFLGIPIGIWALVVLLNEEVKAAFP